jgi:hypothetical protein
VADVLGDQHQHHRQEGGQDRPGRRRLRERIGREGERRQPDPGRRGDFAEVDLACEHGEEVADRDAEDDREPPQHPPEEHARYTG